MNKSEYMTGIDILQGETAFTGIGHNFDLTELRELYAEVKEISGKDWLIKCKKIQRPVYPNLTDFTYVGYVIKELSNKLGI